MSASFERWAEQFDARVEARTAAWPAVRSPVVVSIEATGTSSIRSRSPDHSKRVSFPIRAGFTPWPGMHTTFRGGRLKLHGLEEVAPSPAGDEAPGEVVHADGDGIVVRCGRGTAVRITELQREGRRRMPVDAFLIGERVTRGERFG